MNLRDLDIQYTFDHRLASCDGDDELGLGVCPLRGARRGTETLMKLPSEGFGGLMVVGEGPGFTEAKLGEPFVGRAGKLLDRLFEMAHIDRSQCVLSNATLCCPPTGKDADKDGALREAVPLCRPRLLTEIEYVEPRVIVALGGAALRSLCGSLVDKTVRVAFTCDFCAGARYVHWERCSKVSKCKDPETGKPTAFYIPPDEGPQGGSCPNCGEGELTLQPKRKMCPDCGGKKTYAKDIRVLHSEFTISKVAGAVFRGEDLPDLPPSVKYVIPTYHPSFLQRGNDDDKTAGQFMTPAVVTHLKKARRLLTEDARWKLKYRVTNDPRDVHAYVAQYRDKAPYFAFDIETDNKNPWDVTEIRCVGIYAAGVGAPALVVDTRGITNASHPLVRALAEAFLENPGVRKVAQHGAYDVQTLEMFW